MLHEEESEFLWIIAYNVSGEYAKSHRGTVTETRMKLCSPQSQHHSQQQGMWVVGERTQRFSSQLKFSRWLFTGLQSMKGFHTPSITSVELKGAAAWTISPFYCT